MAAISILTDFPANAKKLKAFVGAHPGAYKKAHAIEPVLFSASVPGDLGEYHVSLALIAGFHVERNSEGGTSIIGSDDKLLKDFLRQQELSAKIAQDGGNKIVEYTGPRLKPTQEIKAIRNYGFRVGRHPLVNALRLTG